MRDELEFGPTKAQVGPHLTVASAGIATYDGVDVVVLRTIIAGAPIELRFSATAARSTGQYMVALADQLEHPHQQL